MERIGYREVLHFHSISQTPLAFHFNARSKLKRDHVGEMIKLLSEKNLINDRIKWRPKAQRSVICLEPKMENEKGTCVYVWVLAKNAAKLKTTIFHKLTKIVIVGCQSTAFGTKR